VRDAGIYTAVKSDSSLTTAFYLRIIQPKAVLKRQQDEYLDTCLREGVPRLEAPLEKGQGKTNLY
jgi:hypothetical protein